MDTGRIVKENPLEKIIDKIGFSVIRFLLEVNHNGGDKFDITINNEKLQNVKALVRKSPYSEDLKFYNERLMKLENGTEIIVCSVVFTGKFVDDIEKYLKEIVELF